jgi:type II secretory pathway pseudopilin PulG
MISVQKHSRTDAQAGFALGLILIVVALIALVVGFMARSTGDAGNLQNKDEARLEANGLIGSASSVQAQFSTYLATTGTRAHQIYAARGGANNANIANLYRPDGAIQPPKFNPRAYDTGAIADTCTAAGNNSDTDRNGCMWYLTRMNLGLGNNIMESATSTNGSAMTNEVVAFTFPLRLSVCQQLNNNLSGEDLNANPVAATLAINAWGKLAPPAAGQQWSSVVNLDQNAGTAPAAAQGQFVNGTNFAANAGAATFLPVINGSPRQNFCVSSAAPNARFVYGQTVFIQ